ncbi:hypothetical protein D3C87_1667090 [compost metagenome]
MLEQGFEQAAFGNGKGQFFLVDADHAAHRAETQIAQLKLRRDCRRVAAAQYGAQASGQFSWVAGFGQIIVGAQFQTEDTIQRLATGREHQHRQISVIVAQLLEQFQTAAVGQHHVQHHRRRGRFGQRLARTLAIVAGAHMEAFLAQPATQEFA